jgi:hypothetical protein
MRVFEIMIIDERVPGWSRVTYPGGPIDRAGGIFTMITCQTIFHKSIIHTFCAKFNHFFSFNQTATDQGLTQVIKIRNISVIRGLIKKIGVIS